MMYLRFSLWSPCEFRHAGNKHIYFDIVKNNSDSPSKLLQQIYRIPMQVLAQAFASLS